MESNRQSKKKKQQAEDKNLNATTSESSETSPLTEVKRMIYVQPFPKIKTTEEYDQFIRAITIKKPKKKSKKKPPASQYNGFKITVDNRKDKTYEDYDKDFEGLLSMRERQEIQFQRSFTRRDENVSIEAYTLPKTEDELAALRKVFSELKPSDILFLNAHGNDECLGIAEVSMNAQQIADALTHLGLPNPSPFIVLWACNTGTLTKEIKRTIIDDLQEILKKNGFESAQVTGVGGYLTTANKVDGKGSIVTATERVKKQHQEYIRPGSPNYTQRNLPQHEFFRHASTPETGSRIKDLDKRRKSMGKQLDEASDVRAKLIEEKQTKKRAEQQEIIPQSPESPERITVQQAKRNGRSKKQAARVDVTPLQIDVVQPDIAVENSAQQTPKRHWRPKKQQVPMELSTPVKTEIVQPAIASENPTRLTEEKSAQTPKRRGRPKKQKAPVESSTPVKTEIAQPAITSENPARLTEEISAQTPKRHWRPKKQQAPVEPSTPVRADIAQSNSELELTVQPQDTIAEPEPQASKKSVPVNKQITETPTSTPEQTDAAQKTETKRRVSARLEESRQKQLSANSNNSQNAPDQIVTPKAQTMGGRAPSRHRLFTAPPQVPTNPNAVAPANQGTHDSQRKTHKMKTRSDKA